MHIPSKNRFIQKRLDETKYMSFLIKMMNYWKNIMKFENKLKSEPVFNEKYLKAKIKSYNRKFNTNFQ